MAEIELNENKSTLTVVIPIAFKLIAGPQVRRIPAWRTKFRASVTNRSSEVQSHWPQF